MTRAMIRCTSLPPSVMRRVPLGRRRTRDLPSRWVVLAVALLAATLVKAQGIADPARWPVLEASTPPDPRIEAFVEDLRNKMTVEEKVGQLIQADIASITPDDLRTYHLGSVLAGGNAAPGGDVRASAQRWLDLTDEFYRSSVADIPAGHPPIPVIFGIDAVHGNARIPGATVFPHNVGLGAAHDPKLVERIGRVTAAEVAAIGIDWTFAPTVAVVRDVRWGRSYESYSEDPALVADYAHAMVAGLQGRFGTPDFMAPGHTLASVKHFLGDGGTLAGRDQFDNLAPEAELRDVHGVPYPAALSAGALIVMASYNGWQGVKMHANRSLLTGVLKERWAFPGFVVGDWNGHEEIPGCTRWSCPEVLAAGLDMYMAPDGWRRLYGNLLSQVNSGAIDPARLDDAVTRILRVKAMAGLFTQHPPKDRPATDGLRLIGSPEHRAVAREAVRASLVLLKNNGHVLPLDPRARILVAGPGADDIGMQCGGWTIDWQGSHNHNGDFPGGTSIYAGLKEAVERAGGSVELSVHGDYAERPTAAVVVYGERPYSEFEGDRETLAFSDGSDGILRLLRKLRAAGIPVVSVFLSGRPLWVNPLINASDAFVAAWLPGSEGGGLADVLLQPAAGQPHFEFTGRLSFSWPATAQPASFRPDGSVGGALFARGFGLGLSDRTTLGPLPEAAQSGAARDPANSLFGAGHVTAPWSIYVADAMAEVRLTMRSQASPARAVTATLTDAGVRAQWSGGARGQFRIGGRPADYVNLARDGVALVARYRVEERPTDPVGIGILCEAPYGTREIAGGAVLRVDWSLCGMNRVATIDLTSAFAMPPLHVWQTLRLPLACLARAGADLRNVVAPFMIETRGRLSVIIDDVRLERAATPLRCPVAANGAGPAAAAVGPHAL